MEKPTQADTAQVDRLAVRRILGRVESRKRDAAQWLTEMAEHIENEEWDLALGLCRTGVACFQSLRDDTNRLADLGV